MDRNSSSFMVVNFPLDKQLDGFDGLSDLGAGNTIVFTHIPAGVAVYFAIDNNSQSKIQALQGMQIKTTHGGIYFTTVGTSPDPMVLAHWASDDMEIITPPISTFESLNGFGLTAFNQLDKAMNPYNILPTYALSTSVTTNTTILNKVCTCDKIDINLNGGILSPGGFSAFIISLNGVAIFSHRRENITTYAGEYSSKNEAIVLYGVIGKTITITSLNTSSQPQLATITEYTLKP